MSPNPASVPSFDSVDYLAADNAPTAVQHFWSLSVEEQFYFLWPIFIGLLALFIAKSRSPTRFTFLVGISVVTGVSLVYSIWMSIHEPAQAYFVTPVRLWELSAGGLVAVLSGKRQASTGQFSALCSWAGLFGIGTSFVLIKGTMAFPGYIALLPIVSTAVVLAAYSTSTLSPMGVMKLRGVQFTGNTSYSIYLWHWPFVVLLPTVFGNLRWWHKFGIIAVVLLLAWLTMIWIEKRFKSSRFFASTGRTFITAAVIMAIAVASGASLQYASYAKERASQSALEQAFSDDDPCLGAEAIESNDQDPGSCPESKKLLLDPAAAKTDKADAYPDNCWTRAPFTDERPICHYGNGKKRVALVGNSHAGHWLPALQVLADENNWTIDTYLVDTCNPTDATIQMETPEKSRGCHSYGRWAKEKTTNGNYDAIITSNRQVSPVEGYDLENTVEPAAEGYKPFLRSWAEAGIPVVVLRDTPFPSRAGVSSVPDCVAKHGPQSSQCTGTLKTWKSIDPLANAAASLSLPKQTVVNSDTQFCPTGTCQAVIGGVIVYFDGSHMTSTYSKTLAPWMAQKLKHASGLNLID